MKIFFRQKKISSEPSLAEILVQARQKQGLTLALVAKELAITEKYLSALETNSYQTLPGEFYHRIFLKKYADFLGLETKKILRLYEREKLAFNKTQKVVPQTPQIKKESNAKKIINFLIHPQHLKIFLIILIITGLVAYLIWQINNFLSPPKLEIFSPAGNVQIGENSIVVSGKTQPEVKIFINNQEILPQPDGSFKEKLDLQTGLNHITITAKKKIGKTTTKYLYILVSPSTP